MKSPPGLAAVIIVVLVLASASVPAAKAQTATQVQSQIGQAFAAVQSAEQAGGNVTALVAKLNSAIGLVQEANSVSASDPARAASLLAQASTLAQEVTNAAPSAAAAGRASVAAGQLDLVIETVVLAALAAAAYVCVPRLFWGLWLRTRRDWRVK